MPIFSEPFGETLEGVAVERYCLVNIKGIKVCILSYGGIIQSLGAVDRNGNVDDVVLGFDTLHPYLREHPYFGAIIGRYANRIAQGKFILEDKKYQLAINNGGHHLHGGIRGFDKQVWHAHQIELNNANSLVLRHTSADGDESYPGTLSVEVTYTWSDTNELSIYYRATTDTPTVLNLTNHSYFNLCGVSSTGTKEQANVLNHRIQINADRYLPIDRTLIPTGMQTDVANTCMDFRNQISIGENMNLADIQISNANNGYDHAWLRNNNNKDLENIANEFEPLSGRTMNIYTTQPAVQFYSGNFLDNVTGKNGTQYGKYAGFCLETQHYPNSPNNVVFPSTVLHPDEVYQENTVYKFGFKS